MLARIGSLHVAHVGERGTGESHCAKKSVELPRQSNSTDSIRAIAQ